MVKKSGTVITKCPHCGEEVTNLNVNYCLKCGNMLWSKKFYIKTKYVK
ncbi:MAG: zinc-ribbon domain-containing protein [Thermoplasmatales archaeon]|nr:zinc-ribbon domain-containing protein [Thermoplasmatales archaeon]